MLSGLHLLEREAAVLLCDCNRRLTGGSSERNLNAGQRLIRDRIDNSAFNPGQLNATLRHGRLRCQEGQCH